MNRNIKKGIATVIFCVVLLGIGVLSQKQQESYTATFFDVFDTRTDIIGYAASEEEFAEQVAPLKEKLEYYHKLYDIYKDYDGINNMKTINDNAGIAPVPVSEDIIRLLLFSKEMYEKTNGQMNIAMGSVLRIWHEYREEGSANPETASLPPMEDLLAASEHCDMDNIIIDEQAMTVYLADAEMSIDVGSIGKGYAVQRVAEYAREMGIKNILFSVGCNICAVGNKPDGSDWRVGIQNPDTESENAYVQKVDISDLSVVTSGDYQRFYEVDGVKYCHIIDADTLMPAEHFTAVSIFAEDSGEADALSTAVFNMPFEEGLAFVNALEDVEAIWILNDGSIEYSDGFAEYLAD